MNDPRNPYMTQGSPAQAYGRRLILIQLDYAPMKEIEVGADSEVLTLTHTEDNAILITTCPEGAQPIRRKVWMCMPGSWVPPEAMNADAVGHAVIRVPATPPPPAPPPGYAKPPADAAAPVEMKQALVVVFVERQAEALTRTQHRGRTG